MKSENETKAPRRAMTVFGLLIAALVAFMLTACGQVSEQPQAFVPQGQTQVIKADGKVANVAYSKDKVVPVNTADFPEMPSISKLLPDCGILRGWDQLVKCVEKNNAQWYIDGINRVSTTNGGITWDKIREWASWGEFNSWQAVVRNGAPISDDQCRTQALQLMGDDEISRKLTTTIWRPIENGYLNTWRTNDASKMTDFLDFNAQCRVILVPLTRSGKGEVVLDRAQASLGNGVYVDCYNVTGHYKSVPVKPEVCPPGTPNAGKPIPDTGCAPGAPSKPETTKPSTKPETTPPSKPTTTPPVVTTTTTKPPTTTTTPPTTTPPTTTTTPPTTTPPTTTPPTTTTPKPKDPTQAPGNGGEGGTGQHGGGTAPAVTGSATAPAVPTATNTTVETPAPPVFCPNGSVKPSSGVCPTVPTETQKPLPTGTGSQPATPTTATPSAQPTNTKAVEPTQGGDYN